MALGKFGKIATVIAAATGITTSTLNAESAYTSNKNIDAIVNAMRGPATEIAFQNGEMPICSELNSELEELERTLTSYGYKGGPITNKNVNKITNDPEFGCEALGGPENFCKKYENQLNDAQDGCNKEFDELYKILRIQAENAYKDYQNKKPVQINIPVKKIPVIENSNTDRG